MGFYRDYEPYMANSSPGATNRYNLAFWHSHNHRSYNPESFDTGYPMLQVAKIMFIGDGSNDLIQQQVQTGLVYRHYYSIKKLESLWAINGID
jgi:hypothetical protein